MLDPESGRLQCAPHSGGGRRRIRDDHMQERAEERGLAHARNLRGDLQGLHGPVYRHLQHVVGHVLALELGGRPQGDHAPR